MASRGLCAPHSARSERRAPYASAQLLCLHTPSVRAQLHSILEIQAIPVSLRTTTNSSKVVQCEVKPTTVPQRRQPSRHRAGPSGQGLYDRATNAPRVCHPRTRRVRLSPPSSTSQPPSAHSSPLLLAQPSLLLWHSSHFRGHDCSPPSGRSLSTCSGSLILWCAFFHCLQSRICA